MPTVSIRIATLILSAVIATLILSAVIFPLITSVKLRIGFRQMYLIFRRKHLEHS